METSVSVLYASILRGRNICDGETTSNPWDEFYCRFLIRWTAMSDICSYVAETSVVLTNTVLSAFMRCACFTWYLLKTMSDVVRQVILACTVCFWWSFDLYLIEKLKTITKSLDLFSRTTSLSISCFYSFDVRSAYSLSFD